jgi:hypothetical protein
MPDHRPIPLREAAERIRLLGQRTPWWVLAVVDGQPVVLDAGVREVVFSIHGAWTPDLVRLFNTYRTSALVALAELLWMISTDGAPTRVRSAAHTFIAQLDLDGHRVPPEVRTALDTNPDPGG